MGSPIPQPEDISNRQAQQMKSQFSPRESHWESEPLLRVGPTPAVDGQPKMNSTAFNSALFYNIKGFYFVFILTLQVLLTCIVNSSLGFLMGFLCVSVCLCVIIQFLCFFFGSSTCLVVLSYSNLFVFYLIYFILLLFPRCLFLF